MTQKVMLEVTQSVVAGNEVVVHSGELFEPGAKLPDGVSVRPVFVDTDDEPAEPPVITRAGVAEADQQPRRAAAAKPPGK